MILSIFPNVSAQSVALHFVSWSDVVAQCINPPTFATKQHCPLVKLAMFGDTRTIKGSLRSGGNMLLVSGVELDYDGEALQPADAAMLLQLMGITAVIYTSPSHTPQAPRWRILAPLSREHEVKERRAFVARINGVLGGVCAGESFTDAQTFYIGRVQGATYECHSSDGQCVDLLANLPEAYPAHAATTVGPTGVCAKPYAPNDGEQIARERITRAMRDAAPGERHYARLRAATLAGGYISGGVLDEEATMQLLQEVSDSICDPGEACTSYTEWQTIEDGVRKGMLAPCESPRKPLDIAAIGFGQGATASHGALTPRPVEGSRLVMAHDAPRIFAGCAYVVSLNQILIPGGILVDRARFDALYGKYSFMVDLGNVVKAKSPWEAFMRNEAFDFPQVHDICFRPELPAGAQIFEAGQKLVNIWWPVETSRTPGDVAPFLSHLAKLFPVESDRAQVVSYLAAIVQYPGVKFQWCPVIQGAEGNGKSFISECIEYAIGNRYSHKPNASDLANKFTGWLRGKLFISIEEIMTEHKREVLDALKPLITNRRVEIQGKGSDQSTGDNRANFLMFTNHKNAIPAHVDKRRYAIYYSAQQSAADIGRDGMGGKYFPQLYSWARAGGLAHIAHFLATYPIPEALNPATECQRAPHTSSMSEAVRESLGSLEQEILEAIETGEIGFRGGFVSSIMLGKKFERRNVSINRLRDAMGHLGYVKHPGLHEGRLNNVVHMPDSGKPRLYVPVGGVTAAIEGQAKIFAAYIAAQGGFGQSAQGGFGNTGG